ncbi:MAG: AAA family ATPase [Allobaculum sp.]|nr:AAA family ATPase [Allobaculum sp.]
MAEANSNESSLVSTSITGKISTIYYAQHGFFAGQLINEEDQTPVRVAGSIPNASFHEGERWSFEGGWENNARYGRQFSIHQATLSPQQPGDLLIGFLSSNLFKGIKKKHAQKIIDTLGAQAIHIIQKEPSVLTTKCALTSKQADTISDKLKDLRLSGNTIDFFLKCGLDTGQIHELSKFAKKYPEKFKRLGADPFYPYFYHSGFGYTGALRLANGFGLSKSDPRRTEGAIFDALSHSTWTKGSTYITFQELRSLSTFSWDLISQGLDLLLKREDLISIDQDRVYLKKQYKAEVTIAKQLYAHSFPVEKVLPEEFEQALLQAQEEQAIVYDDSQKAALQLFLNSSIMILNGGPGTGKSTLLLGLLRLLGLIFPSKHVMLCAPTGRAAKRMSELTGAKARTIHSLLGWNWAQEQFKEDILDCDVLVVDEFSMVDSALFAELLEHLQDDCRVLLIGDEEQLESVGPGNVLCDLIASNKIPVANLKTLHRQKEGSGIPFLAHAIRYKEPIEFMEPVQFRDAPTSQEVLEAIKQLIEKEDNPEDIQILAPRYGGESGIDEINSMIQEIVNPFDVGKPQLTASIKKENSLRKYKYFGVGDKVLLTQNLIQEDVYNGDIGHIVDIDPKNKWIQVNFGKKEPVSFDLKDESTNLSLLTHAWCISIHKSQGSEYQKACVIADQNGGYMLRKRLLYTAVSRAKKHLYIIGSKPLFIQGTRTQNSDLRQTSLKERIEQAWKYGGIIPKPTFQKDDKLQSSQPSEKSEKK